MDLDLVNGNVFELVRQVQVNELTRGGSLELKNLHDVANDVVEVDVDAAIGSWTRECADALNNVPGTHAFVVNLIQARVKLVAFWVLLVDQLGRSRKAADAGERLVELMRERPHHIGE